MKSRVRFFVGVLLVSLVLAGCATTAQAPDPTATPTTVVIASERLTFAGSTTLQPLAEELAKVYKEQHPEVELDIGAGGSRVGIEAIQTGKADIGMASRDLKEGEQTEGMEIHQVAIDVLAMIVHPSNPVDELSLEDLRGIYSGEITNWSEVGGDDMEIIPVVREVSSGTRGAFDDIVLDGEDPTEDAVAQVTAGEVHAYISDTEGAIGYVGFGHLGGDDVQLLTIDGIEPSPDAAIDGSYKLKRPLLFLTGPLSQPGAQEFIEFALSPEGQELVVENEWVPVKGDS
jgi:phosphate transport system substrate-binding protein